VALPGATTHGPAAEALLEGAEYGVEKKNAAEASEAAAAAAARVQPPRQSNWGTMANLQKKTWFYRHGKWNFDE